MKKFIRTIISTLAVLLIVILLLDTLLWHLDPLGVVTLARQFHRLQSLTLPDSAGYRYTPGRHDIGYRLTINLDGLRIVPDVRYADCTIAAVGDSVTLGMGVNDEETFVNTLARAYPNVHWINAGIQGYSSLNIAQQIENVVADAYMWLIIDNDGDMAGWWSSQITDIPPATSLYFLYFRYRNRAEGRFEDFKPGADSILHRDDVLAFVFDDEALILTGQILSTYPDVHAIPQYTQRISVADAHPSAEGHTEIADAIMPYVQPFVDATCAN